MNHMMVAPSSQHQFENPSQFKGSLYYIIDELSDTRYSSHIQTVRHNLAELIGLSAPPLSTHPDWYWVTFRL